MVDVGIFTLPPRLVPDAVLSRIFGALESLGALVVAGACLLTPVLLDLVGVRWTLAVVGALGPAYVVVVWTRLRSIDRTVTRRDKEIELLDQLPMFRPLSLPAIEQLADRLEPHAFEVGADVVTQGDDGDRLYVIEHGTVHVVRNNSVTGELSAGDCFGEIALLRDVPRTSSVVAATDLRVHSLARDDFLAALAGPAASRAAAEQLVSHRLDALARADAHTAPLDSTDS